MWHELGLAFALLLILEGILPFLYPNRWRKMVTRLAEVDSRQIRIFGLGSMLAGTALIYILGNL